MIKKNIIVRIFTILLLAFSIIIFCCVSTASELGANVSASNSGATQPQPQPQPQVKDKIVIPDEAQLRKNDTPSLEMAAAGSNDNTTNFVPNPQPNIPAVNTQDVSIQQNEERIVTPQPQIIIRPTPIPEPVLPETESPGDVWTEPRQLNTKVGRSFKTAIHVNTGAKRLAAYGIKLFYNRSIIILDAARGSKYAEAAEQGFLTAKNPVVPPGDVPGMVHISGFDTAGKGPSRDLEIFIVYWKAVEKGEAYITINIETLVNDNYETIGKPRAINGYVNIE